MHLSYGEMSSTAVTSGVIIYDTRYVVSQFVNCIAVLVTAVWTERGLGTHIYRFGYIQNLTTSLSGEEALVPLGFAAVAYTNRRRYLACSRLSSELQHIAH